MSKHSNISCKLNKNYFKALNWKELKKEVASRISDEEIAEYYGYESVAQMMRNWRTIENWRDDYAADTNLDLDDDDDAWRERGNSIQCCGINELITGDSINKDNLKNRHTLASRINSLYNDDKRVFITGLPVSKPSGNGSEYNFKNYKIIRKILLDFGMKQVAPLYLNSNSQNKLAVLVGQFP